MAEKSALRPFEDDGRSHWFDAKPLIHSDPQMLLATNVAFGGLH